MPKIRTYTFKRSPTTIRTRCRICGRCRYLCYLRPSLAVEGKWICQNDIECIAYLNYKGTIK